MYIDESRRARSLPFRMLFAIILFLAAASAWGLSTFDPNDEIYTWLSVWDEKGYFPHLPMLRPYTPQLITSCLRGVIEKGTELEMDMAREYLAEIEGEGKLLSFTPTDNTSIRVGADASLESFLATSPFDSMFRPGLELSVSGGFGQYVRFSCREPKGHRIFCTNISG